MGMREQERQSVGPGWNPEGNRIGVSRLGEKTGAGVSREQSRAQAISLYDLGQVLPTVSLKIS